MAEQYLALYRKYRPLTFEDVRGRDTIVQTLRNQIITGRISHSYLFCGTRGTGKTTIAKIFARAVNCEHPVNGSPCGECETCRAIAADADLNVVEMDAASNNGVEDVRGIIDQVKYSPTQGRYRVYIIDEVHMLSRPAFNALLKTLEEPPSYAIFILATTEPNKLPVTILSRCQRYDFGRLSTAVIEGRLREVADAEQMNVQEKALRYIASAADGSMRDGLSLLDQCSAFNYGSDELTYDRTLEILGAVDSRVFSELFGKLHGGDIAGALTLLEELLMQGREITQFVADYIWYLRNMMLLQASGQIRDRLDLSEDNLERLEQDARSTQMSEILRQIRIFSELTEDIRYSANRRVLTEAALIRAAQPLTDAAPSGREQTDLENLQEQVRVLARQVSLDKKKLEKIEKNGVAVRAAAPPAEGAQSVKKNVIRPEAIPDDLREIMSGWHRYLAELPIAVRGLLSRSRCSMGPEGQLLIIFESEMQREIFLQTGQEENGGEEGEEKVPTSNAQILQQTLEESSGRHIRIEYKALDKGEDFSDNYDDLEDMIHMPIETVKDEEEEKELTDFDPI